MSPDHNRLNLAEHRVLDQNISQFFSLFWIAAIIININFHKSSTFVRSHADKSIKNYKVHLELTAERSAEGHAGCVSQTLEMSTFLLQNREDPDDIWLVELEKQTKSNFEKLNSMSPDDQFIQDNPINCPFKTLRQINRSTGSEKQKLISIVGFCCCCCCCCF